MGTCCSKGVSAADINVVDRTKQYETDDDRRNMKGNGHTAGTKKHHNDGNSTSISSSIESEMDELHRVSAVELGQFVLKKMNNKTLDRLWKHLDEDNKGQIERDEVLNILQWMAVLYVAFRFRQQGGQGQPQINKRKLKQQFIPVKDWILEEKMNTKRVVRREEFRKLFGAWLKSYDGVYKA
eukprot:140830_1